MQHFRGTIKIKSFVKIAPITASSDSHLENFSRLGDFKVWFLGRNASLPITILNKLPASATVCNLGSKLNEAADRIEHELLNIDKQVLLNKKDRFAWNASLISDRNPYASDLQLNAARYFVIRGIIEEGGHHLFFVDNEKECAALENTLMLNGQIIEKTCLQSKSIINLDFIGVLRARFSGIKQYLKYLFIIQQHRKKSPIPWGKLKACDVLIVDWAGEQSFNFLKPNTRAWNLARMPEILQKSGLKVGYIANPLDWTQNFVKISKNICSAFDPVVMVHECRSIMSILKGAYVTWMMNIRLGKKIHLDNHDLSPIYEYERIKDLHSTQSTMAYTLLNVGKTLADKGVKPKIIVYPYEFQGWERMLVQGIRRYLPETRIVAYQHSPFSPRWIGIYPSSSHIIAGDLPDCFILMGEWYRKMFAKRGFPSNRMCVGGSLRFESHLNAAKDSPLVRELGDYNNILVGPPIDYNEALDLVLKSVRVLKYFPKAKVTVNFHPIVDDEFKANIQKITFKNFPDFRSRIEFSDKKLSELLKTANVLLYNSTGAVYDAMFAGVPIIYVASDGVLEFDRIFGHMSCRVATEDELKIALQRILSSKKLNDPDLSIGGSVGLVNEEVIVSAVKGI